jgi:membrane-bound serine protease (ClpP class)
MMGRDMLRLISFILLLLTPAFTLAAETRQIAVVTVNGPINPVTAEFLQRNLQESAHRGDQLLLVEMDTPGGLDSAMREIVKGIFASPVPVAVYVSPSGARAASAGAVIALAADICAMSPGTNIGAAHPVSIGEKPDKVMEEKLVNDAAAYVEGIARKRGRNEALAQKMVRDSLSLSADKALEGKVIDLIAADRQDLLKKLDGWHVTRYGKEIALRLAGAAVKRHDMGTRERILDTISNPNVAYVLMMLGIMGLFFELANPGVILPGVIGGISLILAFFAFQTLPVNYAGVLLILLAIVMFVAEIKVVSHGMLTVGGVIAMIFGSLLLFQSPEPYLRLSWNVIGVTVLMTTLFFGVAVSKVLKAHRRKPVTGREGLVGEQGVVDLEIMPEGKVFVRGEYWDAVSAEPIMKGTKVEVVAVEGMRVRVRKAGNGNTRG